VYAFTTDRDWENDAAVRRDNCNPEVTRDIADQLIYGDVGSRLKVMLGGGSRNFIDQSLTEHGAAGYRADGRNLIEEWKAVNPARVYVNNSVDLRNVPANVHQLFGLFQSGHIDYNLDIQRDGLQDAQPSLEEMTLKSIEILSQNDNGYFLFVEGGRIDHGHHDNAAKYAIDETIEFSKAIDAAMRVVNLDDTLVVVTADHGHVMTLSGYADRAQDIFGYGGTGQDNFPYLTLSYANGMGYYGHRDTAGGRVDPRTIDQSPNNFKYPATVPLDSETHGGEDVGIWAAGPWAHLYEGTVEQHVIPHIMAYASCVGEGLKMCDA